MQSVARYGSGLFWLLFVVVGAGLAMSFPTELMLGLLVVMFGVFKVVSDAESRRVEGEREKLRKALDGLKEWLEREHALVQELARPAPPADAKALEKKLEQAYRDLVRKVVSVENRLNEVSRAFLTMKPRSGRGKKP